MKHFITVFLFLAASGVWANAPAPEAGPESAHGEAVEASPLTPGERALVFNPRFRRLDEHGEASLEVEGEPLSVNRVLVLSPWDLMELVQKLSGTELPLSRFGNGNGDELTQAWRAKVAAFARGDEAHHGAGAHEASEDPFDPNLVLWDPGFIQTKNAWGQWTIHLAHRDIVQGDIPTLSPLEVQQAVAVLTGRTYSVEYVLEHLEAFRAQLSIVPRPNPAPTEVHP
jgi:hypothetical protein